MTTVLWQPTSEQIAASAVRQFMQRVNDTRELTLGSESELHSWSVENPTHFWQDLVEFGGIYIEQPEGAPVLQNGDAMPGAKWFPKSKLNFAWNLLKYSDTPDEDALVFRGEGATDSRRLSWRQLRSQVLQLARWMKSQGIEPGDRVAGYVPNTPEAIVAMLATTALGGVWSSCSPDFGFNGVLDRFGQIKPKLLFTADGYWYNGRSHDSLAVADELAAAIEDIEQVVVIDYLQSAEDRSPALPSGRLVVALSGILSGAETLSDDDQLGALQALCVPTAFDHPLYIMFSSGTTGKPKCIVHGVGGTLLQHVKEHRLHVDVRAGEKLFFFTTCGWMMWNWLVTGLASGATLLLYDGSPFYPSGETLFDYAEAESCNHFGVSAKYIDACLKAGLSPKKTHQLSTLRSVLSTGSPLVPESFRYVYEHISDDVCLSSMSGGTDILSCFVLGCPALPVHEGEIQCLGFGMNVQVYGDDGVECETGVKGELVCTSPFPCMPIGFWSDDSGERYHAAYFDRFANVWCHGDYVAITEHGGMVIFGRSDAVLNPGGVRIGTAEIYRQVEQFEAIAESLVIGQRWQNDVRVVLFTRMQPGYSLDETLIDQIKRHVRTECTPRHVPAKIIAVDDIPRTRSGKIVELAVGKVVHGEPVDNVEALANPEALELYKHLPQLQT